MLFLIKGDNMLAERRKFIRFDVPLDVIFKISDDSTPYSVGTTKNFSRHGCCIESKSADIKLHKNMDIQVKHPTKDIFVYASGNVVWKQQLDNDRCLLGIDIIEMNKEAKSEILDFAYDIWLEKNINPDAVN